MIYILYKLFIPNEALKCDFETPCRDFVIGSDWGITDGYHPLPLDHDNTYRNRTGHYIFASNNWKSEIVSMIDVSLNESRCLEFAYYSENILFNVTIDDRLTIAAIQGPVADWRPVSIVLPNLRYKLVIRANNIRNPVLLFDDLSVGACSGPNSPAPVHTIYFCDFENPYVCQLNSLPYYSYKWLRISAFDANKHDNILPSKDYTIGNSSGHYFLSDIIFQSGGVGYFSTANFTFSTDQIYCLHFLFYRIGSTLSPATDYFTTLEVFAWTKSNGNQIHLLFQSKSGFTNSDW
jgi:hypothetical protein